MLVDPNEMEQRALAKQARLNDDIERIRGLKQTSGPNSRETNQAIRELAPQIRARLGNLIRFQDIADVFGNVEDIVTIALKLNPHNLNFASHDMRDNPDIVHLAVQQTAYAFQYAGFPLKNDPVFIMHMMVLVGAGSVDVILGASSDEMRRDVSVARAALSLAHANSVVDVVRVLRDTVIWMDVTPPQVEPISMSTMRFGHGRVWTNNPEHPLNDVTFCSRNIFQVVAIVDLPEMYNAMPDHVRNNPELIMEILEADIHMFDQLKDTVRDDPDIVIPMLIEAVDNGLDSDNDFMQLWQHVGDIKQNNENVIVAAVRRCGYALVYAADEFWGNPAIVSSALNNIAPMFNCIGLIIGAPTQAEQDYFNRILADGRLAMTINDVNVAKALVALDAGKLEDMNEANRDNPDIVSTAIFANPSAMQHASNRLRSSKDFILHLLRNFNVTPETEHYYAYPIMMVYVSYDLQYDKEIQRELAKLMYLHDSYNPLTESIILEVVKAAITRTLAHRGQETYDRPYRFLRTDIPLRENSLDDNSLIVWMTLETDRADTIFATASNRIKNDAFIVGRFMHVTQLRTLNPSHASARLVAAPKIAEQTYRQMVENGTVAQIDTDIGRLMNLRPEYADAVFRRLREWDELSTEIDTHGKARTDLTWWEKLNIALMHVPHHTMDPPTLFPGPREPEPRPERVLGLATMANEKIYKTMENWHENVKVDGGNVEYVHNKTNRVVNSLQDALDDPDGTGEYEYDDEGDIVRRSGVAQFTTPRPRQRHKTHLYEPQPVVMGVVANAVPVPPNADANAQWVASNVPPTDADSTGQRVQIVNLQAEGDITAALNGRFGTVVGLPRADGTLKILLDTPTAEMKTAAELKGRLAAKAEVLNFVKAIPKEQTDAEKKATEVMATKLRHAYYKWSNTAPFERPTIDVTEYIPQENLRYIYRPDVPETLSHREVLSELSRGGAAFRASFCDVATL